MKITACFRLANLLFLQALWLPVPVLHAAGEIEVIRYFYDANGNPTNIVDPLQYETNQRFDALNRLVETRDALGGQTRYSLDNLDQIVSVTDPAGTTTRYRFDALGNPTLTESPDRGTTNRVFDDAGNLIAATDARGATLHYQYDALDRLVRIDGGESGSIRLSYDEGANALGRLTSLTDETGRTSWQYDALGRLTTRTSHWTEATLTLRYGYDGNGRLRQIIYPSGQTIGLTWNNGQVVEISLNGLPLLTQIQYQPFGPANAWTWGNGISYGRLFDRDGRPVQYPLGFRQRTLDYDAASRILNLTDGDPLYSKSFEYDALHRLLSTSGAQGHQTFDYDANGNRLSENGLPYTYAPASNRLQNRGSRTYEFDAAGNVTSDGSRIFTYDAHGRLQRINTNGASFEYQYDGFGIRAAKWSGHAPDMAGDIDRDGLFSVQDARKLVLMVQGILPRTYNADCDHDGAVATQDVSCVMRKIIDQRQHPERYNQSGTLFLYDTEGHLLGEYHRDGQPVRETVWLGEQPVVVLQPGAQNRLISDIFFVYADHLNTPRAIVDHSGLLVWRWEGEPFGTTPSEEAPDGDSKSFEYNLRFPGQYYDAETGLHYNLARYYDPVTGRYLQPDPAWSITNVNAYAYAGGNPTNFIDPDGQNAIGAVFANLALRYIAGAAIGGGTSAAVQYWLTGDVNLNQTVDDAYIGGLLGLISPTLSTATGLRSALSEANLCTKGIIRYGPMNPGPLDDAVAATFRGGSYAATTLSETTTLYRVYGGSTGKLGPYWTRTQPNGPLQSQLDSALAPQWGNTAQNVVSIRVPKGTTIYEGAAAPQSTGVGQILGGGNQVYIPRVDPKWIQ